MSLNMHTQLKCTSKLLHLKKKGLWLRTIIDFYTLSHIEQELSSAGNPLCWYGPCITNSLMSFNPSVKGVKCFTLFPKILTNHFIRNIVIKLSMTSLCSQNSINFSVFHKIWETFFKIGSCGSCSFFHAVNLPFYHIPKMFYWTES